jgi:hypothetical protein
MKPHADHVASQLTPIGEIIEAAMEFRDGKRANFLLLVWTEGVVQVVANTPKPGILEVLKEHIEYLEGEGLIPGAYRDSGSAEPV